jgi:predicted dehydrogenase
MMVETSYYHQSVISARKWHDEGQFGNIFCCEAEYHHPGLEKLFFDDRGNRTWRYGLPPMLYSTHCTGQLMGVTGERLTEVTCYGWGDDSPILKNNPFKNPYWGETALFKTDRGNALRAAVYWRGALGTAERAVWLGENMSFFAPHPNGMDPIIRRVKADDRIGSQLDGKRLSPFEKYDQKLWWETDLLPEPLRHISGHDGSHTFLTHEFISALVEGRRPAMDLDFALDTAIPGIIAHQSAMQGGKKLQIPGIDDL